MMVLQATPVVNIDLNDGAPDTDIPATTVTIWPADKCTWTQTNSADGEGYLVENAIFWPGVQVTIGTNVSADGIRLNNTRLGFIGKSGRFVAISDAA